MTLATHAVVGGLVGAIVHQNPVAAGLFGFASHFLLDAIPHWDYHLASSKEDEENPLNNDITPRGKSFYLDLVKIAIDFCLGLIIIYLLFSGPGAAILIGAIIGGIAGTLPDPLQFVYMRWRHEPMITIQKFHLYMHAKLHLKHRPVLGVSSQLALIIIVGIVSMAIF